ncbi:MAG: hypothetical protein EB141_06540 [Verrucomicrobia bacterium]|nr:hypothetical protein [Verrucomicrobiota bacterium]
MSIVGTNESQFSKAMKHTLSLQSTALKSRPRNNEHPGNPPQQTPLDHRDAQIMKSTLLAALPQTLGFSSMLPLSPSKLAVVAIFALATVWSPTVRGAEKPTTNAKSDWNQWRGPNRNGVAQHSPKLADAWGPEGPVLVWKSAEKIVGGPKKGGSFSNYGSPVVAEGKVYLYVHDQVAAADVIFCLDANTGKTLWKASYPGRPNGGCSSTPYVGGGNVFAVGSSGMYCLNAETGKEVWKTPSIYLANKGDDLAKKANRLDDEADATGGDGINTSPALVDGVLVVMAGSGKHLNPGVNDPSKESGVLKGFDPATGKELWACPQATSDPNKNGDKSSSVAVWNTDKGPRLITQTGKLTCVNPKDGSVIWEDHRQQTSPGTTAIVGDVCITAGKVSGYRLQPDKAEELFAKFTGDRVGSYLLHDGHVFGDFGGTYRCIDLNGKVVWQKSVEGGYGTSSPVLADGKIFHIVNFKDAAKIKLTMFSASTTMPATFYEASVSAMDHTSPAICDGRLFIRLVDGVACYDLTKAPAHLAKATEAPVPIATRRSEALISFVDVSPSYWVQRKQIKDQVWPPEKEAEAATLDWAVNKTLDAEGWVNFIEVQDARGMPTRDQVVYARVVLEASAPGKLALSLSVPKVPASPHGIAAWVNGTNVLRHDVAHGLVKEHEELIVNLIAGKNTLLVRANTAGPQDWKLQVQARALDGLKVKQVGAAPSGKK